MLRAGRGGIRGQVEPSCVACPQREWRWCRIPATHLVTSSYKWIYEIKSEPDRRFHEVQPIRGVPASSGGAGPFRSKCKLQHYRYLDRPYQGVYPAPRRSRAGHGLLSAKRPAGSARTINSQEVGG